MSTLTARQMSVDRQADVTDLQVVLDNSSYYSILVEGKAPSPNEARELLTELPPDKSFDDKLVLGIYDAAQPVGCVDLIRGFPEAHVAYLGLLLFTESAQGRGFGHWALDVIEGICASWGCTHVRLAVAETNLRGHAFWQHQGFAELYRKSTATNVAIVMERANKAIHATCEDARA